MGNETQTTTAAASEPAVPNQGITVEVSYATVAAFEQALEVARRRPTFQQFGEGKSLRFRVTYQMEELDALWEMKEATWELRHKRCWLHGNEVEWYEMARLTHCFREYLGRPRRDHCFFDSNFWNGFGCRYALANLSDRINNDWLGFGQLEPGGVWAFDKPRIAAYVRENIARAFHHCPAYDEEYLTLFLEIFPERVDPVEDDRWMLLRDRQGQVTGCGPASVDAAKKIVYEFQDKIRARRGADKVQENAKRRLPGQLFALYKPTPTKKKPLLTRLFG